MNSESMSKRAGADPLLPVSGPKLQGDLELPVCEVEPMTFVFCGASKILDAPGVKGLGQQGPKLRDSLIYSL